ncbi:aminotransferase class I/II-fold pyridoxal phosphate-dependent enzyme [Sinorhizobium meliloti]|uniref:aminotransferase-like domain-containing protein n=1 Tax=Rhizobium meliloti TaxID=382 RepID=UPI001295A25E|nr:PLP-dependent aminotransferase family protein [Sinorhizobium meliloti]MQX39754.1 aminotransferase class I/II-fold pyridoxal phosphate-dependent enzyme [Sinorhizobium meliloti]
MHGQNPKTIQSASSLAIFDMTGNLPPPVPHVFESEYRWAMQEVLNRDDLASLFASHSFNGTERDRAAGAEFVSRRLSEAPDPDQIVITNSTQVALLSLILGIVGVGGRLVVDHVTYPSIGQFASFFGYEVIPLPIDAEGMEPEAFRDACRTHSPKAVYSTPTLQNPTTGIMSLERRQEIANIAREYGVTIIEDDIYSLLPTDQPPPLSAFAPEISWYVLGTTKGVAAGLKTCYVVAPSAQEAKARFWPGVRATYWMCAPANVTAVTRLIESGRIEQIISAVRDETRKRQAMVAEFLAGTGFRAKREGLHVWLPLPARVAGRRFVKELELLGTRIAPGELYAVGDAAPPNGVRFGTGKPASVDDLRMRVEHIRATYEQLMGDR